MNSLQIRGWHSDPKILSTFGPGDAREEGYYSILEALLKELANPSANKKSIAIACIIDIQERIDKVYDEAEMELFGF